MLHWLLADMAMTLGFLIALAFPVDPDPSIVPSIFSNKIYYLNIPLFIVGTIVWIVGYFCIWRLWLKEDWALFKGAKKGWIVASVILEVINYIIIFLLFYLVMFLFVQFGFYGDGYRWVDYSIFGVWVILLIIQFLPIKIKKVA